MSCRVKKILVTGGRGFIGSKLAERLKNKKFKVSIFDLQNGNDITKRRMVTKAVKGQDLVFHFAAAADLNWAEVYPFKTTKINVEGTAILAEECGRHGIPLVYISTCCVYGRQNHFPTTEQSLPNPSEIYASSKLAGEEVVKGYHSLFDIPYMILRLATNYGPGMRSALGVHIFFRQALKGEPITVHGKGLQTRNQTYVEDTVNACLKLVENGAIKNEVLNISAPKEISALEMARTIKKLTKSSSEIIHIEQRRNQVFREAIDSTKAKKLLGWQASTSFDEGLEKTLRWFLKTGQIKNIPPTYT